MDHLAQVQELSSQLVHAQLRSAGLVHVIAHAGESKVLVEPYESERHPDLSVYLTPPPDVKDVWSVWLPAIVIEIVSSSSADRDYNIKPPEYLSFGVTENWIVDAAKKRMTVLERWRGEWRKKIVKIDQKYSTRLLPGFTLDVKRVLTAR